MTTQRATYLVAIGKKEIDIRQLGHMTGIADIHRVSDDYKLVSRKWKVNKTSIDLRA
ncbi:MAG: 3-deoxy-7-phosphoheptulonate synthase, partial [Bacteroidia bacterium]|nr:3-deoxy-7-phosphoheptulonate synthase [Bacteroidia bacterium]